MKRSILTEKVARRGYHISQEYGVDPLERLSVGEVMSSPVVTIPAAMPIKQLVRRFFLGPKGKQHQGYPVVGEDGSLLGIVTKTDLLDEWADGLSGDKPADETNPNPIIAFDMMSSPPVTALAEETCRAAVERMVQTGIGRLVVVDPDQPARIVGMVTRSDVLKSRSRLVDEEESRERFYLSRNRVTKQGDGSAPTSGPPRKTA